jgi:hypothetical protein
MEDPVAEDGADSILEVRVRLEECDPEIWRLLELAGSLSLGQVHEVLQTAFGWEDEHLQRFTAGDPFARLRPVDGEIPEPVQWLPAEWCEEPTDLAEEDCSLDQLLTAGSGGAFYEYDFGDSWLHRLDVVTRRPRNKTDPAARLLAGARRGPLEDSGGFPGYEEILDVLADAAHPNHVEVSEWVADLTGTDEPYDPDFLDVDAVNRALNGRSKAVRVP